MIGSVDGACPIDPPRARNWCGVLVVLIGNTLSPFNSYHNPSPDAVNNSLTSLRSALARSRQVAMPNGCNRRSRRPAMPEISVTGSDRITSTSAGRSSTACYPKGLVLSEINLASVRDRAIPTETGTRTRSQIVSRISVANCWWSIPFDGTASKKDSSIE